MVKNILYKHLHSVNISIIFFKWQFYEVYQNKYYKYNACQFMRWNM